MKMLIAMEGGLQIIKKKVKEAFFTNRHLVDDIEIRRAVARGRFLS